MAIQFTQNAKNGIAIALASSSILGSAIYIYSTALPFPSAYLRTSSSTFGGNSSNRIASNTNVTYTRTNNRITSGVMTFTTTINATLGWFFIGEDNTTTDKRFISDSIGLSGSGALLVVNTLTVAPGTILTFQFNLSII